MTWASGVHSQKLEYKYNYKSRKVQVQVQDKYKYKYKTRQDKTRQDKTRQDKTQDCKNSFLRLKTMIFSQKLPKNDQIRPKMIKNGPKWVKIWKFMS